MKILIAEEEQIMSKVISRKLQNAGYEVVTVANGLEAADCFETEQPDLVITNIMMSYMSGLELVNHLREEQQSNIPIMVLSAVQTEDAVAEALDLGADDYMKKPFNPVALEARVARLLDLKLAA